MQALKYIAVGLQAAQFITPLKLLLSPLHNSSAKTLHNAYFSTQLDVAI